MGTHFSCNIDVINCVFISNGYTAAPERDENLGLDKIFSYGVQENWV